MHYSNEGVGYPADTEAVAGDGTVIALLKRHRTLLGVIAGSAIIASATVVGGRLLTSTVITSPVAVDQPASSDSAVRVRDVPEDFNGVYSFALVDQAGSAAATNYVCIFNPAASTDTAVVLGAAAAGSYAVAAVGIFNGSRLTRITTCTGGTLQAATAIAKYDTGSPNPTLEVRTANPAVTAAAEVWPGCFPVATTSTSPATCSPVVVSGRLLLLPGEGLVYRQTAGGDVDARLAFGLVWGERNN